MNLLKKLIPFVCLVFLFACDGENIDELLEKELEKGPTIVYEDEGKLNYLVDQVPLYDNQGFGALEEDIFYIVSSDSIFCYPGGGVTGSLVSEDAFVLYIIKNRDGTFSLASGFFVREFDGVKKTVIINPACKGELPSINITQADRQTISGSFEGEGYVIEPDGGPLDCEDYANSGKISATFSVPILICD